jgi:hypothetical protein
LAAVTEEVWELRLRETDPDAVNEPFTGGGALFETVIDGPDEVVLDCVCEPPEVVLLAVDPVELEGGPVACCWFELVDWLPEPLVLASFELVLEPVLEVFVFPDVLEDFPLLIVTFPEPLPPLPEPVPLLLVEPFPLLLVEPFPLLLVEPLPLLEEVLPTLPEDVFLVVCWPEFELLVWFEPDPEPLLTTRVELVLIVVGDELLELELFCWEVFTSGTLGWFENRRTGGRTIGCAW